MRRELESKRQREIRGVKFSGGSSVLACETRELTIGMFPKGSMTTMIRKAIESMIVRDSRVGSRIQVFHKLLESIKY